MKLNNKGQTLILFVLLLPLMLMALALVVDLGLLLVKTTSVKSVMEETIQYGLDSTNVDKEQAMNDMLKLNLKDDKYSVVVDDKITITVTGEYDSIFATVFKAKKYTYNYKYVGYKENNKNIIEKEG